MTAQANGGDTGLDPGMVRVRQRLRALRSRYPGTALTTEITIIHVDQVVVRAILSLPDGTTVTAHAAEPADAAGLLDEAIEQAEWRATTRALDLLGVGDFGAEARRQAPARPSVAEVEAPREESAPEQEESPQEESPQSAVEDDESATESEPEPVATVEDNDIDMADFTWTHLWTWARGHGITNRLQVEERIGRSTTGLGPGDIHAALIESGLPES
jgi:hypothetical protein